MKCRNFSLRKNINIPKQIEIAAKITSTESVETELWTNKPGTA